MRDRSSSTGTTWRGSGLATETWPIKLIDAGKNHEEVFEALQKETQTVIDRDLKPTL